MGISKNLFIIRNKKKISQQEMADYLGVDRKTYKSWEDGKVEIKYSYVLKLAEILQVEASELLQDKPGDVIINQHNMDNKDTSINNSIVLIVTDKETVDQIFNVLKPVINKETNVARNH